MGIYVETRVQAPLNALWTRTQTPALHEGLTLGQLPSAARCLRRPRVEDL
jgi:hypothetical protein